MAEILGLGLTHSPSLIRPDEDGESSLKRTLRDNDKVPAEMKIPTNWPEPMRIEYGEDEGLASAKRLRDSGFRDFKKVVPVTGLSQPGNQSHAQEVPPEADGPIHVPCRHCQMVDSVESNHG